MPNSAEMSQLTNTLSRATSIPHVYDETLETRGGGIAYYMVECGGLLFLAWFDEDTQEMIISPLDLWDIDNLKDSMDDPMPLLHYRQINRRVLDRLVSGASAAAMQPSTATHSELHLG